MINFILNPIALALIVAASHAFLAWIQRIAGKSSRFKNYNPNSSVLCSSTAVESITTLGGAV